MADAVLAVLDHGGRARLADADTPVVRADDLAVVRGEAVFETLRAYAGRAFLLDEHLARMRRSAARLALPLPEPGDWRHLAETVLSAYGEADGVLRLICTKGAEGGSGRVAFAHVTPMPPATVAAREGGVEALTLAFGMPAALRPGAPWLLGGVKSTSYAVAMASLRRAAELAADDVVWVSSDGEVLEAPTSTVALVRDGRLVTPPAEEVGTLQSTSCAGRTRQCCCPVRAGLRRCGGSTGGRSATGRLGRSPRGCGTRSRRRFAAAPSRPPCPADLPAGTLVRPRRAESRLPTCPRAT